MGLHIHLFFLIKTNNLQELWNVNVTMDQPPNFGFLIPSWDAFFGAVFGVIAGSMPPFFLVMLYAIRWKPFLVFGSLIIWLLSAITRYWGGLACRP